MLMLARLLCQSPRNMATSQPCFFASAVAQITKFKQSSLCSWLLDLSPKWMSVKTAAFLKSLSIEC